MRTTYDVRSLLTYENLMIPIWLLQSSQSSVECWYSLTNPISGFTTDCITGSWSWSNRSSKLWAWGHILLWTHVAPIVLHHFKLLFGWYDLGQVLSCVRILWCVCDKMQIPTATHCTCPCVACLYFISTNLEFPSLWQLETSVLYQ
jgi:hypothetical protein